MEVPKGRIMHSVNNSNLSEDQIYLAYRRRMGSLKSFNSGSRYQFDTEMSPCEDLPPFSMEVDSYSSGSSCDDGVCRSFSGAFLEDYPLETLCSVFGGNERFNSFSEFFNNNETSSRFFPKPETLCSLFGVKDRINSFSQICVSADSIFVNGQREKSNFKTNLSLPAVSPIKNMQSPKVAAQKLAASMTPVENRKNPTNARQNSNLNTVTNVNSKFDNSPNTDVVASIMEEMDKEKIMKTIETCVFGTVRVRAAENNTLRFPIRKKRNVLSRISLKPAICNENFDNKISKSLISQNELLETEKYFTKCEFCQTKSPTSKENEKLCVVCYKEIGEKWKATTSNEDYEKSARYNGPKAEIKVKCNRSREKESNIMSRAKKVMSKREIHRLKNISANKKGYHHMKSFTDPEEAQQTVGRNKPTCTKISRTRISFCHEDWEET